MGLDIKAAGDVMADAASGVAERMPTMESLKNLFASPALSQIAFYFAVLSAVYFFFRHTPAGKRVTTAIEEVFFTNWRLGLLGSTSLVLSLVAGYTTFDGLRNFTGGGLLSLAATFGIQGVMLVTAWLIGESFASGMNFVPGNKTADGKQAVNPKVQAGTGAVIGILLFIALLTLVLQSTGQVDVRSAAAADVSWSKLGDKLLIVVVGLLLAALMALYSASDMVQPYLQGARVIVKNSMLWVMFLACMSVSVFFSFDSHFSGIFPQAERVRAAELRAQNQVAGILADIGQKISETHLSEAENLFNSEGWRTYDKQLGDLAKVAQASTVEIERYFNDKLEERNRAIKQQQERIVTAQSGQAGLASKKTSLTDELAQLEGQRPSLAADYAEKKQALDTRAKEVDAKRVEAMAEDRGVEGSGKSGRGPVYRQRMDELGKLQDYLKIGEERVKDAQKRLSTVETRIAQIKRELAAIDGDLAKYKGEAETAEQRIKLTQEQLPSDANARVDPARVVPAFEAARAEFRQEPTPERLSKLQQQCSQLYNAMIQTEVTKSKVSGLDCDPKHAAEAAAPVFALVAGTDVFGKTCAGGDKLAQYKTTDELFGFARKCLADSGLPSKQTDQLRTKINFIELNRDDKAHRFVVTWNAFLDGNRLAYLALAIAITIDSLVFMSGLFGANAVRSPLQDVPSVKARSAHQLEAIIENALLPDRFENARLVLGAMKPITQHDGYVARIALHPEDPHAADIRRVLNAGATIGAVRHVDGREDAYELRAELFEFLSVVAKRAFESDKKHTSQAELEKVVTVALMPDIGGNAQAVLDAMHPITEDRGFTATIDLVTVDDGHKRVVRNVLNAGATLQVVQKVETKDATYFIHGDFYKTLARIRARNMLSSLTRGDVQPQLPAPQQPVHGGALQAAPAPALAAQPSYTQIAPPQTPFDAERWRQEYRGHLFAAIGLRTIDVEDRLTADGVPEACEDAWNALHARASNNPRLAEYMRRHQDHLVSLINQTYSSLRGAADDPRKVAELDQVSNEIRQSLSKLILFPETGLIDYLIMNLERAAGHDDGLLASEHDLLIKLRHIRESIVDLDLTDANTWAEIQQVLQSPSAADEGMPRVVAFRKDERRR